MRHQFGALGGQERALEQANPHPIERELGDGGIEGEADADVGEGVAHQLPQQLARVDRLAYQRRVTPSQPLGLQRLAHERPARQGPPTRPAGAPRPPTAPR